IDFAARNGLDAHGIYGYAETPWYYDDNFNFGWAGPNADVTKPIPCLNMPRIVEYARSKGVGIHLWVHWRPLYDKLEEAFALYEGWGVKGLMVDFMDRNDQEMIRIQEEILECAARHRLFIQFHGSSKPSGLVRTYPNEFTREGTLNYEVCKWDTLVNADHDIAIPFTRMLAGATDYHLGGFRALPRSEFKIQYVNPHVMSTRCHMLAMYVVLENHLTSLCDTPKAYEGQPGFEVLRTVPGTWDEIRVPLARMNEHVTVARRSGSDWWVGSLNNGTERDLKLELDFLSEGDYQATIYTDAEDVERNPNNLDR
ncbi:glycoside hydrolase family 97 catalytic domain-containing protein, partial [Bacteroides uniformis]